MSYNYLKGSIPDGVSGYDLRGNKDVCSDISYYQVKFLFQPCFPHKKGSKKISRVKHILVIVVSILGFFNSDLLTTGVSQVS